MANSENAYKQAYLKWAQGQRATGYGDFRGIAQNITPQERAMALQYQQYVGLDAAGRASMAQQMGWGSGSGGSKTLSLSDLTEKLYPKDTGGTASSGGSAASSGGGYSSPVNWGGYSGGGSSSGGTSGGSAVALNAQRTSTPGYAAGSGAPSGGNVVGYTSGGGGGASVYQPGGGGASTATLPGSNMDLGALEELYRNGQLDATSFAMLSAQAGQQAQNQAFAENQKRYNETLGGYQGLYGDLTNQGAGVAGGYSSRYDTGMGLVNQMGESERARIERDRQAELGRADAAAASRGFYNSTVATGNQALIDREAAQQRLDLEDRLLGKRLDTHTGLSGDALGYQERLSGSLTGLGQNTLGFMERRTDEYPDNTAVMKLLAELAKAGVLGGAAGGGAGGGGGIRFGGAPIIGGSRYDGYADVSTGGPNYWIPDRA